MERFTAILAYSSSHKDSLLLLSTLALAFAGLVNAIVAPMVQNAISKRSFRATVISASRVKWMEDLRKDIVNYVVMTRRIATNESKIERSRTARNRILRRSDEDYKDQVSKFTARIEAYVEDQNKSHHSAFESYSLIRLKLNSEEPLTKTLFKAMEELMAARSDKSIRPDARIRLEQAARDILQETWRETKKM